ncbi:MAG: tetratricopeptide repeat protein [Bacteroidetes bacterium]|nr:tetratricopeptide repeat protein [Bacteroidota bacterium]
MTYKSRKSTKTVKQKSIQVNPPKEKDFVPKIPAWAPSAIIVFTALIYLRALFNDFANLDDDMYILKNPYIRDFSLNGIKAIFTSFYCSNYHPLTTITYLFEFKCFGLSPFPYHLINVILHLINTFIVYKLSEKLSGNSLTALIVTALFAVHPMHVESVAWVSERKDVLYALFYLLALLVYLRYIGNGYKLKYYTGVLFLFILSLLSKSAAVTLPLLMILVDIYKGRKINTKSLLEKIPFLLLSVVFGILAIMSQQVVGSGNEISLSFNFIERIFLLTYTLAFYLVKLVFPFNLSAMHYYPNEQTLPWEFYATFPFLLITGWLLLKKTSLRKVIFFGVIFFIITISVMLQIVHVGFALAAERYSYIPYLGLFFIIGQWITDIQKIYFKKVVFAIFFLFIIIFSYQTYDRIGAWKNGETLFTDIIKKNPEMYHAYWMRGNIKYNKDDLQGALIDYNKAIEYNPYFTLCFIVRGDIHNRLNNYNEALKDLNKAISSDSTIAEAYNTRGMTYLGLGNTKLALNDYNKAVKLTPKYLKAYINRGVLKAKTNDLEGAMKDFNIAIDLNPIDATLYNYRGNVKNFLKDFKSAVEDFNYSLKLDKSYPAAYYNRGVSRFNLKDTAGACEDWNNAMKLGDQLAPEIIRQYCK